MMGIFIIQVHDPVIHLEVDEEQLAITRGGKRQAERTGFLAPLLCLFVCFFCSHWSLVDVLLIFCPADHVPDWQPRILLGIVEARSVNVKKTTITG